MMCFLKEMQRWECVREEGGKCVMRVCEVKYREWRVCVSVCERGSLLEKVAASSLSRRSSFLSFIMVSETMLFSVSYFDLRLESATCHRERERERQ